jgi:hypothetical protein
MNNILSVRAGSFSSAGCQSVSALFPGSNAGNNGRRSSVFYMLIALLQQDSHCPRFVFHKQDKYPHNEKIKQGKNFKNHA